jgi:hypothetical protein
LAGTHSLILTEFAASRALTLPRRQALAAEIA